jgi:2-polyprenyl-3-methyl-5-hydroxy-6-metoxy-1,4-benzoquinol methylase
MKEDTWQPHAAEWSPERIARFWDWYSTRPALREVCFSKACAVTLVRYVKRRIRLSGIVLDAGSGTGDLAGHLLQQGIHCAVADVSEKSLEQIKDAYAKLQTFEGTHLIADNRIDITENSVETVFFVEVIEHLLPEQIEPSLRELRRICKPGGHIVVTTPNEEKLERNTTICPQCGCYFHSMQHISSFSADTLTATMSQAGFQKLSCEATCLLAGNPSRWREALLSIKYRLQGFHPHLIYIGRKD